MIMIIGALILLFGMILGFGLGRIEFKRKTKEPICICKHHLMEHKNAEKCAWFEELINNNGTVIVRNTCSCLRYYGPQPDPALFVHPDQLKIHEIGG